MHLLRRYDVIYVVILLHGVYYVTVSWLLYDRTQYIDIIDQRSKISGQGHQPQSLILNTFLSFIKTTQLINLEFLLLKGRLHGARYNEKRWEATKM